MVCRLIDFALVVLKLLMFKGRGVIGISKIEFFNFSGTERLKVKKFHSPSAIIEHFEKHSILRLRLSNLFFLSKKLPLKK